MRLVLRELCGEGWLRLEVLLTMPQVWVRYEPPDPERSPATVDTHILLLAVQRIWASGYATEVAGEVLVIGLTHQDQWAAHTKDPATIIHLATATHEDLVLTLRQITALVKRVAPLARSLSQLQSVYHESDSDIRAAARHALRHLFSAS